MEIWMECLEVVNNKIDIKNILDIKLKLLIFES